MHRSLMLYAALTFLATMGWLVWEAPSFGGTLQETLSKTDVQAPAERVFALIEDFHNWTKWSPHEQGDSPLKRTYSGAPKGKGAIYQWDGDNQFGAGRAQIADADAPAKLVVDLDFSRPVRGQLKLNFTLQPNGTGTKIAVSTNGPDDVVKYAMETFFGGDLIPLSCAAGGSPQKFCALMMKHHHP